MEQTNQKVLIIGGGLGGLALAQGLLQVGIPFRVFERDQEASFRAQGYRIRISQDGGDALKKLLPPMVYEKFETTCSDVVHGGHQLNALTGQEAEWGGRMPSRAGKAWNADRTVLRNVLLSDLEEHVDYRKKFQKYELLENAVKAHFADGSVETGRILVGADGIRSQVRRQKLPDNILLDTEGRAIFGKTPIAEHTLNSVPAVIGQGLTLIGKEATARMKLFIDVMKFSRNTSVDLPQDYIYWVLLFQKAVVDKPDSELMSLSNTESADLAEKLTSTWHDSVRSIIKQQLPEAASTLMFLMAQPPLSPWKPDGRITLLGDAGHPMPPVGGVGANAAFQDAAELLRILEVGADNEGIAEYEQSMRDRCNKFLAASAAGAGHFFGMKPVHELKPVAFHA